MVRDYSSHPSPRPVALPFFPQFYHSLSACFSIDTLGRWPCKLHLKTYMEGRGWQRAFLFICFTTIWQGEQKQTGQRDGDSLACHCFQHPHIGKQGNHFLVLLTPWKPLIPLWEAWLLFSLEFSSPRTGSLAWLSEQSIKPKDRLESQNQLGLWFFMNCSLATSLTWLFLLLQGIILLPYHWINQLCLKAWKHHVFLFNI